jgi:hypothetical protein
MLKVAQKSTEGAKFVGEHLNLDYWLVGEHSHKQAVFEVLIALVESKNQQFCSELAKYSMCKEVLKSGSHEGLSLLAACLRTPYFEKKYFSLTRRILENPELVRLVFDSLSAGPDQVSTALDILIYLSVLIRDDIDDPIFLLI